jgi:hypothetical protein
LAWESITTRRLRRPLGAWRGRIGLFLPWSAMFSG